MNWNINGRMLNLTERGMIMGILNTTPDSFSDGGTHATRELALQHALQMIEEGADIIDIGGESTRPGAPEVSAEEEIQRVIPVIESLRQTWSGLISIDTSKAIVAKAALLAGANIINDVSGLRHDPAMLDVCRETDCGIIIMHMRGNPRTMQVNPQYDDVVTSVREFFEERYQTLKHEGISADRLCFDPGIGMCGKAGQGVPVGVGVHRDGGDVHRAGGADDAGGDLAAVGDEQFGEHSPHILKTPKPRRPALVSSATIRTPMAMSAIWVAEASN